MKCLTFLLPLVSLMAQYTVAQPGAFSLVSPTNGAWASTTPFFDWGNSTGSTYYQLWIDGTLKKDSIAISQYQITPSESLSEALHTWFVRAKNAAGQTTQSTEAWSVIVDATTPTTFDLLTPYDNVWVNDTPFDYSWQPSIDLPSGLKRYELQIDGSSWASTSPLTTTLSSASTPIVKPGAHTWRVLASDSVDNITYSTSTRAIRFDYSPPEGAINPAISFNGTTSYVNIPQNASLHPTSQITLEAWINFQPGGTSLPIIIGSIAVINGLIRGVSMYLVNNTSSSKAGFQIVGTSLQTVQNLSAGTWYHVACVYDGSYMYIYINGVLDSWRTLTGTIGYYTNGFAIGAPPPDRGSGGFYKGLIDEVRVWQVARTGGQINLTMVKPLTGNETNLAASWRFNEGIGVTVRDLSSWNNHGTLMNGANFANTTLLGYGIAPISTHYPSENSFIPTISPTFMWGRTIDNGIGFQKYQLWVDGQIRYDNLTDTTQIYEPLSYGNHTWYVKTFDQLGNTQQNYSKTFYVDTAPPNPFNLVSPNDSQFVAIPTPTLSWQITSDSTGGSGLRKYQLWIDGSVNIDSIPVSSQSTSPSSPLSESPHNWFVRAIDNVGNVRQSQTRTFFVDFNPPTTFDLVSPANGDTVPTSRPRFTWRRSFDAGSGVARYELRIVNQPTVMVQASDTSAQPTFSLPNGSYTWQVVAFDRAGAQRISNQNWTVVVNLLPPAVPTLLSPLNGSINLFTSLTLSWNASTGADIYHLQVATDSNFATIIRNDSTLLSTSSPVGPLANAATYYWRVRAKNFAGASAYFLVWDFRTIPTLPSQLLLIFPAHAAVINADSVILVWGRGQPEVDRYWLQIASDSLFTNNVLTDSTLIDTSYVARQLVNNQTNWWRVKAHNVAGWGSFGSAYKFTAIITEVGTPENLPDHFALHQNYPNPFNPSTSIIYDVPTTSHIRLTIFDLLGREIVVLVDGIQQPGRLEVVFTATNLASGIYLYRIETATFRDTKKLVLLR